MFLLLPTFSSINTLTDKISLVTFDTATLQRFDFEAFDSKHSDVVRSLKCEGSDTALFDSIDECLEKFQQLNAMLKNPMTSQYLLIVTDGGNNFGKKESAHAARVAWRSGQLQISGHMIQVGDNNRKKTRLICDAIKYKFNHFNGGNVREFVHSFSDSIKTESRARATRALSRAMEARNRSARTFDAPPPVDPYTDILESLPEVPNTPIDVASKEKLLA